MEHIDTLPKVVLTDAIHPEAHAMLADAATVVVLDAALSGPEALQALRVEVQDAQGLIVRRQLPPDLLEGPHALRGIVRHGVGLDFIPVESATQHGVPVANTPAVNANAVAEYAMTAMLDGARRFRFFDGQVRQGNWNARKSAGAMTFELRGRTIGIVGFGSIGNRIAEIATGGFGMRVAACTRTPSRLPEGISAKSLEDLFACSDFVVLACPLTEHTRGMINRNILTRAKPGLFLVNVARGAVINEPDLVDALAAGHIGGAALDVFTTQPLPMDSPLRDHPRVAVTPHLAGVTQDAELAMGLMAVESQLALIRGERPDNVVNRACYENEETR